MRNVLLIVTVFLLAACAPAVDRCTADPNLPECQAARAVAQSTIASANANTDATVRQAQLLATKDAMSLSAQATQSAVIISSTAVAVSAAATRTKMETDALRDSLALTATLQAVQGNLTGTRTALEAEAKIRAITVDTDTAGLRQWLLVGTLMIAGVATAIAVTRTTTRTTERVGNAIASRAENHAALVRYGPNNERIGLLERGPDGRVTFKPADQALAALDYWLPRLNVPDQQKLLAIADYSKRSAVIEGVGLTGAWPVLDDGAADDGGYDAARSQISAAPAPYAYTIVTPSATAHPIAGWLDEVELKLLPSAAATGGTA